MRVRPYLRQTGAPSAIVLAGTITVHVLGSVLCNRQSSLFAKLKLAVWFALFHLDAVICWGSFRGWALSLVH